MAVDIQRKGRRGVSQVALDSLDVIPALNCGDGVAMAKVMDPSLWKANRRSQALKVMIDGVRGKMLPQFI